MLEPLGAEDTRGNADALPLRLLGGMAKFEERRTGVVARHHEACFERVGADIGTLHI